MPIAISLPEEYGAPAAVALSTTFLVIYHTILAYRFRHAAGIKHPQGYAELQQCKEDPNALKFNCAQRAHANMLENLPMFLMTIAWTGLRFPLTSAALGGGWILGRVVYAWGYVSDNPTNRVTGFNVSNVSFLVMLAMGFYSAWELFNGKW
ncbi:membrane-associated proteins in eicosanoid and glutathione metabolism [Serendipita vermifera]|nr:membrane-associated proteins in eicosanoid and glutathione metabolism [Serendipita vermifera]